MKHATAQSVYVLQMHVDRQGMGVTGGEPVGFDVGAKGAGGTLPGLDLVSHHFDRKSLCALSDLMLHALPLCCLLTSAVSTLY